MNPNAVKSLVVLLLSLLAACLLGLMIGTGDLNSLILLSYLGLGIFVMVAPGFVPLLAVGLLSPFIIPVPFVQAFPFLLMILGICVAKLFFWRAVARQPVTGWSSCFHPLFFAFFGWVALRYCMNPVMPNLGGGLGQHITGFRSYMNYGVCFALLVMLPFCIRSMSDALRLVRWMVGLSLFFVLLMLPMVFSKSEVAALWLMRFGLFISAFDNGWWRLVVLPGFGLILITVMLFPRLLPLSPKARIAFGALGSAAVFLGGTRSGLIMVFVVVLTVAFVRRQIALFSWLVAGTAVMLVSFHLIGETIQLRKGVGVLRVLSLTSRRIAQQTDAADTIHWRKVRWHRALQEIRNNPIFGKGYGGLQNAWIAGNFAAVESALVEIDLASGGIHNGYLNASYSLGIPSALVFIAAIGLQILRNAKRARQLATEDPILSDLHTLICANLVALVFAIYIGTDLNGPMIWFYLGLGVLLTRFKEKTEQEPQPNPTPRPQFVRPALGAAQGTLLR